MRTETSDPAAIEKIFGMFEALASPSKHVPKQRLPQWFHRLERRILWFYIVTTICLIAIASLARLGDQQSAVKGWALAFFSTSAISGCLYIIVSVTSLVMETKSTRGRSHGTIFDRMKDEAIETWVVVAQLRQEPRHLVEYAFSQYSAQWDAMGVRMSMLTGDFLRLGLLPALAATTTAAAALAKEGSNIYLWVPISLAAMGYIMVFLATASRERVRQCTDSIKYLLTHWDKLPSPNVHDEALITQVTAVSQIADGKRAAES